MSEAADSSTPWRGETAARRAFSETCDPRVYVERAACAEALRALEAWTESEAPSSNVAALVSSPGLGKTFLLRLLEHRAQRGGPADGSAVAPMRALYLPYAGLGPTDLTLWVHGLLGRACPPLSDDDSALGALCSVGREGGAPLTLLIDDADSMPAETVRALVEHLPRNGESLRVLLALGDDSRGSRLLAAFHSLTPREVRYMTPLSPEETRDYLHARLRWAGSPEDEIARVDGAEAQRIHALSGGVPRAIHAIALERFEIEAEAPGTNDLGEKRRREDWMGRPIEDERTR